MGEVVGKRVGWRIWPLCLFGISMLSSRKLGKSIEDAGDFVVHGKVWIENISPKSEKIFFSSKTHARSAGKVLHVKTEDESWAREWYGRQPSFVVGPHTEVRILKFHGRHWRQTLGRVGAGAVVSFAGTSQRVYTRCENSGRPQGFCVGKYLLNMRLLGTIDLDGGGRSGGFSRFRKWEVSEFIQRAKCSVQSRNGRGAACFDVLLKWATRGPWDIGVPSARDLKRKDSLSGQKLSRRPVLNYIPPKPVCKPGDICENPLVNLSSVLGFVICQQNENRKQIRCLWKKNDCDLSQEGSQCFRLQMRCQSEIGSCKKLSRNSEYAVRKAWWGTCPWRWKFNGRVFGIMKTLKAQESPWWNIAECFWRSFGGCEHPVITLGRRACWKKIF